MASHRSTTSQSSPQLTATESATTGQRSLAMTPSVTTKKTADARTDALFFPKRFFDHEFAGTSACAFVKAALLQDLPHFLQHLRAAAQHHPVRGRIDWRNADVLEKLPRGNEVGDAAAVTERLAGDG